MQTGIDVIIGEKTYTVTTFAAFKGLSYLQKLLAIVGPSIGEAFSTGAAGDNVALGELTLDQDVLSKAIALLIENLDKTNVAKLVTDMVKDGVTVNGQTVPFDQEFSANYGALVTLVGAIIKENYSSFFGESGFGGLQELLAQPQSKPE